MAANGRLRIDVIGNFALTFNGIPLGKLGRKAQSLIGYLALQDDPKATRDQLTGLLWSESAEGLARGSLRHSLHEVQAALRELQTPPGDSDPGHDDQSDPGPILADRTSVALDKLRCDCDLWDVFERLQSGRMHPLLLERSILSDSALDGFDNVDPAFDDWLRDRRQQISQRLIAALEPLLPSERDGAVPSEGEQVARALHLLEPSHEPAARILILARWWGGDVGAALKLYRDLWARLGRDFDTEPSPETQNLVARLRLEQPDTTAPIDETNTTGEFGEGRLGGYDARPSIAVLPFQTLGPAGQQYLGDGIVENIIQALGSLRALLVISKGSTSRYRSASPDIHAIAQELGVRYVLTGTVQKSGEQLRIHTMLTDTRTAEVLVPKRYDGRVAELFDLQDKISLETTKAISPFVRDQELRRALRTRPQNWTAYDLVLQALGPLHDLDYASFSRARSLLLRSIEIDATYAPAYSFAAHWHCRRIAQEWSTDVGADVDEAARLSQIAIGLDVNDATAWAVHAHVLCIGKRDYDASRAAFARALEAGPNSAYAWTLSSVTESCADNGDKAASDALTALRLSPGDNFVDFIYCALAQAYFVSGNYREAIKFGRLAISRNHNSSANLRILAASAYLAGEHQTAREAVAKHIEISPRFSLDAWFNRTWLCPRVRENVADSLRQSGMVG